MVVVYYYFFLGWRTQQGFLQYHCNGHHPKKKMFVCLWELGFCLVTKKTLVLGHDVRLWIFILCKLPNFNLDFYKVWHGYSKVVDFSGVFLCAMQLQTSNWSKGDIDQSIKRLIFDSCEILWSFSITSSTHNFVASQHFHPQLWCNILTMIFMLHTLGLPNITLRFNSCMPQWSCCSMIFNLIHSTHCHDYCVSNDMVSNVTLWHMKWKNCKTYLLKII